MKTTTSMWVLAIVIIAGTGLYFLTSNNTPHSPVADTPTTQNPIVDNSQNQNPSVTPIPTPASTNTQPSTVTQPTLPPAKNVPMTATIVYGPNGFSPSTITIAKGSTVTFTNQGNDEMWIASNPHPTHEGYSGTTKNHHCPDTAGVAFDQCSTGTSYSFTFQKVGSWGYHNHGNAGDRGTIIVK